MICRLSAVLNFYCITDPDLAGPDDEAIQRQLTAKLPKDRLQHPAVLLQSVRIVGGHHAAAAQVAHADQRISDAQNLPCPLTFCKPLDAADDDIRAQPPAVVSKGGDRAVGGDQQRQDVEASHVRVAHQTCSRAYNRNHFILRCRLTPTNAVYQRLTLCVECPMMSEQPGMRSCRDEQPS